MIARISMNNKSAIPIRLIEEVIRDANEALKREPYSVIDKKTLPPSGNPNDYWHPAPYWWPNPKSKDGLPYIRRDGVRVPGTRLYEKKSDQYDRSRLQRVFDDSYILALGWNLTGNKEYSEHGVRILKRFFINTDTRMSPHLKYAQVRMGRNNNEGASSGIIEMKDMYYYLDAVRLFQLAGLIPRDILKRFKKWLSDYLSWLLNSPQGKNERQAKNNHGTYFDLQVASIADFLDDRALLIRTIDCAQSRVSKQFAPDGSQPEELKRNTTAHYCSFNLQGWINIADIATRSGNDLWSYQASNGASLVKGVQWLLSYTGKKWPFRQIDRFDSDRHLMIWFAVPKHLIKLPTTTLPKSKHAVKPKFFSHDGIRPYWNIDTGLKVNKAKHHEIGDGK